MLEPRTKQCTTWCARTIYESSHIVPLHVFRFNEATAIRQSMDKRFFLCLIEYKACIYILLDSVLLYTSVSRVVYVGTKICTIYIAGPIARATISRREKEHMPSNHLYFTLHAYAIRR